MSKKSHITAEKYPTVQAWMSANLTKDQFDHYIEKGHKQINVSRKTWYNYRHNQIKITYAIKLTLVNMFGKYGFTMETLKDA